MPTMQKWRWSLAVAALCFWRLCRWKESYRDSLRTLSIDSREQLLDMLETFRIFLLGLLPFLNLGSTHEAEDSVDVSIAETDTTMIASFPKGICL
jgi:hypothetical protein